MGTAKLSVQHKILFILFALVYANQSFSRLAGQSVYYWLREGQGLSASTIGLIGFITSVAWSCKILFGWIVDNFRIKNSDCINYLYVNYILIILSLLALIIFPLTIYSLVIFGFLINFSLAFNDVAIDRQMVKVEKECNLNGKSQACQWMGFGVFALITAFLGAKIADSFSEILACKVSYGVMILLPIATLLFLKLNKIKDEVTIHTRKSFADYKALINKKFGFAILFIAFLQFCPSFGLALNIKARECLMVDKMFLGYLSMLGTGLGLIGYFLYYKFCYKFPIKKLLYFTLTLGAISNLFYLYIPNKWFLVAYGIIFGIFGGISFLTLLNLFVKIIPVAVAGFGYALVTSISNFSANGSGFIGGMLFDSIGYTGNVLISSALTLCCLLFIPFLKIGDDHEN